MDAMDMDMLMDAMDKLPLLWELPLSTEFRKHFKETQGQLENEVEELMERQAYDSVVALFEFKNPPSPMWTEDERYFEIFVRYLMMEKSSQDMGRLEQYDQAETLWKRAYPMYYPYRNYFEERKMKNN